MTKEDSHPRELLDERYAQILDAVHRSGGSANTSRIKALTGISTNQVITQRMDRLEEWGFVQTGYEPVPKGTNRLPTKVATLTGYGREVVESGMVDHYLEEDRIEDVEGLNSRVDELDRRLAGQRDDVDELRDRVDDIEAFLREAAGYDG